MTQRTVGFSAAATISAVRSPDAGSTSTSSARAPTALTASAVAMNELAGTITSSPGPISNARKASAKNLGARGHPYGERRLTVSGEVALERLHVLAQCESSFARHLGDDFEQLTQ